MRMLDTNVLVHMQSGRRAAPIQGAIASVAAKEFLIAYGNKPDRERYYPSPAMSWRHSPVALADAAGRARHPTRRKFAERLIIDFPDQKETVIEFSNRPLRNLSTIGAWMLSTRQSRALLEKSNINCGYGSPSSSSILCSVSHWKNRRWRSGSISWPSFLQVMHQSRTSSIRYGTPSSLVSLSGMAFRFRPKTSFWASLPQRALA